MRSSAKRPPLRLGIFGHYGNKNLGDESIIEAVFQGVRRQVPEVEIIGLSAFPDDTSARYDVPAFPIRLVSKPASSGDSASNRDLKMWAPILRAVGIMKTVPILGFGVKAVEHVLQLLPRIRDELGFLAQSYGRLKELDLDLLLVCGSNQFLDNFGGPAGFPYTLLKWTILTKLAGVPIAYISVGAGPIFSNWSMAWIRTALLFSNYTSFRDNASKRMIEHNWLKPVGHVYPDLAHGLDMSHYATPQRQESRPQEMTIGINPMPVYDRRYWYVHDDSKYSQYVQKLGDFSGRLMNEGYRVFFFPTQVKDENVIDDVLQRIRQSGLQVDPSQQSRKPRTVYELIDIIESADILVATRFHGTVLSLTAEKPTLGICYYRKAEDLLKTMGQGDYAVKLEDFTVDDLYERFKKLEARTELVRRVVAEIGREYRTALEEQYRAVLRLPARSPILEADVANTASG